MRQHASAHTGQQQSPVIETSSLPNRSTMNKLVTPFAERAHGPVAYALEALDGDARILVRPVADHLARSHVVAQGVSAVAAIVRAQGLLAERGAPTIVSATAVDALLAFIGTSADMLAKESERLAEWVASAATIAPNTES